MKNKIKEIRKEKGLKQKELAKKMNLSPSTLSQIENSDNVTIATLEKVASALSCSVFDLIDRDIIDAATAKEKDALSEIAGKEADAQLKKAFYFCEIAGYKWEWENHAPGMIRLVDIKTGTKYAVTDEAFTAAVDSSAQFIEFNFAKLIENAKIID